MSNTSNKVIDDIKSLKEAQELIKLIIGQFPDKTVFTEIDHSNIKKLSNIPIIKQLFKDIGVTNVIRDLSKIQFVINEYLKNEIEKEKLYSMLNKENIFELEFVGVEYDRESPYDFDSVVLNIDGKYIVIKKEKRNFFIHSSLKEIEKLLYALSQLSISEGEEQIEIKTKITDKIQSINDYLVNGKPNSKLESIKKKVKNVFNF